MVKINKDAESFSKLRSRVTGLQVKQLSEGSVMIISWTHVLFNKVSVRFSIDQLTDVIPAGLFTSETLIIGLKSAQRHSPETSVTLTEHRPQLQLRSSYYNYTVTVFISGQLWLRRKSRLSLV